MSEEIKVWIRVPLSMSPEMRRLMLRADEFTVDEMWIMLLAAAPTPPAPETPTLAEFDSLLERYWDAAYAEGKEGRAHDTFDGVAARTLAELHRVFKHRSAPETISTGSMEPVVDDIMCQAQVFASTWALIGGQFDNGILFEDSEHEKEVLRTMIAQLATLQAKLEQAEETNTAQLARIAEFDRCIQKVASALGGVCCGGVDGDQSNQSSTTSILVGAIGTLQAEYAYAKQKATDLETNHILLVKASDCRADNLQAKLEQAGKDTAELAEALQACSELRVGSHMAARRLIAKHEVKSS